MVDRDHLLFTVGRFNKKHLLVVAGLLGQLRDAGPVIVFVEHVDGRQGLLDPNTRLGVDLEREPFVKLFDRTEALALPVPLGDDDAVAHVCIRSNDKAEIMQMHITDKMGLGDVLAEDPAQSELFKHRFGQSQIDRFGVVRGVAILFVGNPNDLLDVVHGKADMGVTLVHRPESAREEFEIDKLTDDTGRDRFETGVDEALLDRAGYLGGKLGGSFDLFNERIDDLLFIPDIDLLL